MIALVYACRKDVLQQDEVFRSNAGNEQATTYRFTPSEIAAFVDSIPEELVNRQQRVASLIVYEEIKRLNPGVKNAYGQPLWKGVHSTVNETTGETFNLVPLLKTNGETA